MGQVFQRILGGVTLPAWRIRRLCQALLPIVPYPDKNVHTRTSTEAYVKNVIATDDGPKAIGPYSQAIRANGFVFVSGQIALDPATQQLVGDDVKAQTERVLENLKGI